MKKKYVVIGIITTCFVLVTTGIGITLVRKNNDKKDNTKADNTAVENIEYSGVTAFDKLGFSQVLDGVDSDSDAMHQITGELSGDKLGFMGTVDNYSDYVNDPDRTEEEIKEIIEELDIATQTVPKDSVISGYTNLGVSNAYEYLNVRKGPSLDDKIIGKMPGYCACEILEEENGWYKIKSGDVEGYVYAELMVTGYDANVLAMENMEELLVVTTDVLNVREEPNTDCEVSTQVSTGEKLEILEDEADGWYKININNLVGYVAAEYVEKRNILPTAIEVKEVVVTVPSKPVTKPSIDTSQLSSEVSQTAVDLINYAMQFLGNPYVAGGNSLTNGTDCSGFTKLIFAQFGYNLPRTSADYLYAGTQIPLSSIKPGDLLLYKYGSRIGHVAIYIGNNQIIHASTPRTGITISNAYYTYPYCAIRVIP